MKTLEWGWCEAPFLQLLNYFRAFAASA